MNTSCEKPVLLFCFERQNRNSLGALLHAIERSGLADRLAIELCDFKSVADVYARHRPFVQSRGGAPKTILSFSFMTVQLESVARALRAILQNRRAADLFIAGGPHAAALPEETLRLGFDVVFSGEAEETFPAFIQSVLENRNWQAIPGIAWKDAAGNQRRNAPAPAPALDDCWTCSRRFGITAPLEITRGCFFACKYCFTPRLFDGHVRHRSIERAVSLAADYHRYVSFLSPNAFSYGATKKAEVNIAHIVRLLSGIKDAHPELEINFGTFPSEVRPEYVSREVIRELKPLIANRYMTIGAQSGSDAVLRAVAREHSVADVMRAIEAVRDEGLHVLVDLIFGLPGEQRTDVIETRRLIERFISSEVRFRIHRFAALPGTPFATAPPGHIDRETTEFLLHYERKQLVSGEWR
jgi:B12-binding domain/radical SAM domain protein